MKCPIPRIKELDRLDKCLGNHLLDRDFCMAESIMANEAAEKRFKLIGHGALKNVYKINKNCVLKLPLNTRPIGDLRIYNRYKNTKLRSVLLPVLAGGKNGGWAVYPMAHDVVSLEGDEDNEEYWEESTVATEIVWKKLLDAGFECFDRKRGNVGRIGKDWYLLDYDVGLEKCVR